MNISKLIPSAVTTKFARQILLTKKNSPQILFGLGVASGITSTVLACRATLKLEDVLAQNEELQAKAQEALDLKVDDYSVSDYNRDLAVIKVRSIAKVAALYGPAIGAGIVAVGCFAGGQSILTKRNVALTAAYGALDKGFKEYRSRVEKELGIDKERELRYATEEVEVKDADGKPKKVQQVTSHSPSVYAKFFDEYTKNWQEHAEYNRIFIKAQQNYANDLLQARGHLFLNEVYDMLGIERSSAGCVVGWLLGSGGDDYVDFGIFDSNNEAARDFINGREASVLLDFNVDGTIYDKI